MKRLVLLRIIEVALAGLVFAGRFVEEPAEAADVAAVSVLRYAQGFCGVQHMPPDQEAFILGWEVEKLREQVSTRCAYGAAFRSTA